MVYYRDNLPNKITDSAYLINLDKYCDIGTHWIISYALNDNVTFFDSFGVEHIPKKKKKIIRNNNIQSNILRIQAYNSGMCRYFCVGFIGFML